MRFVRWLFRGTVVGLGVMAVWWTLDHALLAMFGLPIHQNYMDILFAAAAGAGTMMEKS